MSTGRFITQKEDEREDLMGEITGLRLGLEEDLTPENGEADSLSEARAAQRSWRREKREKRWIGGHLHALRARLAAVMNRVAQKEAMWILEQRRFRRL